MTPQFEADELLRTWQRNRHRPPELRLIESHEDFSRLHEETMSMFRATVSERANIERAFHGLEA